METRLFNYGGLKAQIWRDSAVDWFTTNKELSQACGVTVRSVQRLSHRADLLDKGAVISAEELASKLSLDNAKELGAKMHRDPKGARNNNVFWTREGMIYAAFMFRTPEATAFKREVIDTIIALEKEGYASKAELAAVLQEVREGREEMKRLRDENESLRRAASLIIGLEASHSGSRLAAQRKVNQYLQ